MKIPMFPCKYNQKGGFSMAMLVFPRHPVIFSADDWVVQSPPQDGI